MKKRILLGFGMLFFIFLMGSLTAVLFITRTTHRMDKLILLHQVEIRREDLIIHIQQVQSTLSHVSLQSGGDVDALTVHVREMENIMSSCVNCHHAPELMQNLLGMRDLANDYKTAINRLVTASENPDRADELERRARDIGQELLTMTQGMAFTANVRLQQDTKETMATIRQVRIVLYATLFIGLVLSIIAVYGLAGNFERRFRKLLEATRHISRGDLEHRVDITDAAGGEFRELGDAINAMTRDLQRSRRQLVQSAKLSAVSEFAANIAYEVNNPLTGVLGYAGLLIKSDDIPPEKKEHLRTIERETLRARKILRNLLDFARRKPPQLVKTDISKLIGDTLDVVKDQARLNNVNMVVNSPDGFPAVAVDADEVKQVFVNIINNAFFAMQGGGSLTINCRNENDLSGKEFVALEFTDTGIGIPEDQLDKIFDPFVTLRPEGDSSGLGLSISYMIVQNHGGRIEVESMIGKGSTFRVLLPV